MLGHRELTFEDYKDMLRRRWWILVVLALVGSAGAFAYSLRLPERFESQTLVLVEQQKVPDDFVRPVVTEQLNQRLGTLREQILSRTHLEPIIEQLNLFQDAGDGMPLEAKVDSLRSAIKVTPIQPVGTGRRDSDGMPGFYISVIWPDPQEARGICERITSKFIEENLRLREAAAIQTTDFIQKQLEEAKAALDEQDAKLAAFKQQHIGKLPGQEHTNLNILMGLHTQAETVNQALNRVQQDRTYAESLLAQQLAGWKTMQGGDDPVTLEQQLGGLRNQLIALEARYTADHPDVIKLKADIAQLQRKIEAGSIQETPREGGEALSLIEPPHIVQLRSQVHSLTQSIAEYSRQLEHLRGQIATYQARVQLSPVIEQGFKELSRDHETAQRHYNDLLGKRNQSEMATSLERRQQAEQFRVIDPANLPEKPSFPNRPMFAMGGLMGGFTFGIGLIVLLEMRDKTLRGERDVDALLGLPTLARVPLIPIRPGRGLNDGLWGRIRQEKQPEPTARV
jgi:polysaccharide chain length determinant protein (PEP-CTERM system associated)